MSSTPRIDLTEQSPWKRVVFQLISMRDPRKTPQQAASPSAPSLHPHDDSSTGRWFFKWKKSSMQRLRGNPVPLVKRDLCPLPSPQTTKDSWVIVLRAPQQGSPVILCAQRAADKKNISYPVCKALKVLSVTVRRRNSSARSTEDRWPSSPSEAPH